MKSKDVRKTLGAMIVLFGIMSIFGVLGSHEIDRINELEVLVLSFVGFGIIGFGFFVFKTNGR